MEVNENHIPLAYADDIIIMGDMKQDIYIYTNSMFSLIKINKYMGLLINEENTKYVYMTRNV